MAINNSSVGKNEYQTVLVLNTILDHLFSYWSEFYNSNGVKKSNNWK